MRPLKNTGKHTKKERAESSMKSYYVNIENRKENMNNYYQDHRENIRNYKHEKDAIVKDWYDKNVDALSCLDCGLPFKEFLPGFAQFHHVVKSKRTILGAIQSATYNNVVKEIEKGVLLCPNCHRIRHLHLKMEADNCRNSETMKRK